MSTPSKLPWILSQWHAISSSSAPIKMDGVLFQDIQSIILTMINSNEVKIWSDRLTALYNHLSDYDNPHQVNIDQLPISVIEYLYQQWRKEGYQGDIEFFIMLIFTYIKIIQFAEMMTGKNIDSEVLAPSVAAVRAYIDRHDQSLDAHDPIFGVVYAGDHQNTWPTAAFFQYLDARDSLTPYDVDGTGLHMNIPAFGDLYYAGQTNTVVGSARFKNTNRAMYGVHGAGSDSTYVVRYSWATRSIQLKLRQLGIGNFHGFNIHTGMTPFDEQGFINEEALAAGEYDLTVAEIDMRNYLTQLDDPDYYIASALVVDRHRLKLAVRVQNADYTLDKLVVQIAGRDIPDKAKGPVYPRLLVASMNPSDPLQSVAAYREAMSNLQLLSLLDGHQFPIVKTA